MGIGMEFRVSGSRVGFRVGVEVGEEIGVFNSFVEPLQDASDPNGQVATNHKL